MQLAIDYDHLHRDVCRLSYIEPLFYYTYIFSLKQFGNENLAKENLYFFDELSKWIDDFLHKSAGMVAHEREANHVGAVNIVENYQHAKLSTH